MDYVNRILRAAIILPVTSPPLRDGAIVVNGDHIKAVGRYSEVRRLNPSFPVEDLGDVVLMPGLVNAHTHLELTSLRNAIPAGLEFVQWILELVRQKRQLSEEDILDSTREGIGECLAGGVTAVGDIATSEAVLRTVLGSPLAGLVFREVIGEGELPSIPASTSPAIRAGISPHSSYTVPASVLRSISSSHAHLAIHAAESPAEVSFLKDCSGPIAEQVYPMARWPLPEPSGLSPIAFLDSTGILDAKPLLIHGVQVNEEDVRTIARHGLSVVHCPQSNSRLGVGRFPFELYRQYGVNIALGTDSAIGTNRLDLFDEMREAKRLHGNALSFEEAVQMATVNGARALGLDAGALEAGRRADVVALALKCDPADPYRAVVERGSVEVVRGVWIGGRTPGPV